MTSTNEPTQYEIDFEAWKRGRFPEADSGQTPLGRGIEVQTPTTQAVTSGGIYLPDNLKSDLDNLTNWGIVTKIGSDAYKDDPGLSGTFTGPWVKVGDLIRFERFGSIVRFTIKGGNFAIIPDIRVLSLVTDYRTLT